MNKTQERTVKVLQRMSALVSNDVDDAMVISACLEEMLSNLNNDDFFGTEGQNDPRGDQRNNIWYMTRVEGIDK